MATQTETAPAPADPDAPPAAPPMGIKKKTLATIAIITILVWAFAISTGSTVLLIIVGVLTLALAGILFYAFRTLKKQQKLVGMLQGSMQSPEARKQALADLSVGKDASTPVNVFARAQLMAQDEPKRALELLSSQELKFFPAAMQDDVSLLKAQLCLGMGRTAEARKSADSINLDNPQRKEIRPLAATVVAEAWARAGKPKEALALLETIDVPKQNAEQILIQQKVARIFARFATNQRNVARTELIALADEDLNHLARFVMPQFRVHPELQKLARQVIEQHPAARQQSKKMARGQKRA